MNFSKVELEQVLDDILEDRDDDKKKIKRHLKKMKDIQNSEIARTATLKFLDENPHVHVGYVIEHLYANILSTMQCCEQLKISPNAFLRLRKKYGLEPVYIIKNNPSVPQKRGYFSSKNIKAIKCFYSPKQLKMIPESEIILTQTRAARSLEYPNGKGKPWGWTRRGIHPNGKLQARTNYLKKLDS